MPSIQTIRQANSKIKELGPGLVGIFAGGTSGVGESTCREFVRNTRQPTVYIIGQSQKKASNLMAGLTAINSEARITFLQSDLTLLTNVDSVCREILAKENVVSLLFLSAGFLSMNGRVETPEGLDRMFSIQYYSRMRFIVNLLPLLSRASTAGQPARVVSVLGAGKEGNILTDDLMLKVNYSLKNCVTHTITMTTLALEQLALANPEVDFIHTSPGVVRTNITRGLGPVISLFSRVVLFLASPLTVPVRESGERHLYLALGMLCSKECTQQSHSKVNPGNSYRFDWKCEACGQNSAVQAYQQEGVGVDVWQHTVDVFTTACGDAQ
ncbi:dehydrogenase/reductase SDR family member on chromosome X [Aspergillus udagawae]|uniref:Dehydrogenase/reductase SDR family member on chromosome X n=1 Tax=Aspergillus udagawae TaxID=91492 RepID=A0A8H3MZ20_9EURO|nr:dehydrogenase/reductase SDR family member on chromosome X [Aspergillus udagawae]